MKRQIKQRLSIRHKIILMMCTVALVLLCIGISLGYYFSFQLLRNVIGGEHLAIAQRISMLIGEMLSEKFKDVSIYASNPLHIELTIQSNLKYGNMKKEDIRNRLMETDKEWIAAPHESNLISEVLHNKSSQRLMQIVKSRDDTSEILLTDKFGALISASNRTTDFYQADEEWWEASYDSGKGKVYISDVVFDDSTKIWGMSIAVPVRDVDGAVAGIYKAVIKAESFFSPLERVRIGKTGHAVLINGKGSILFHQGVTPLSEEIYPQQDFLKLLYSNRGWGIVIPESIHKDKSLLAAIAKVEYPLLLERGLNWLVIVEQDAGEVFAPLGQLIFQMVLLSVFLLLVLIPVSFIFAGVFIKPINELYKAVECIGRGEFDCKLNIKTGDEIEELADAFNQMTTDLKNSTTSIVNLNKEIANRKEAEAIVRRAAEEWQRTFDSITDLVFIQDTDFTIIKANKAFIDAVKSKPADIIGKKCFAVLHKLDGPWPGCPFKKTIADNQTHIEEVNDPQVDMPFLITTSPIFDESGRLTGSVHIAKDITEIVKSRKELERANSELKKLDQLKSDFISTVSHELRTPLSITKEGISLVIDRIPGEINQQQDKILTTARDNIDRLARIINNLLDISKIEAGKVELKKELVNIVEIINNVGLAFDRQIKEKGLTFRVVAPQGAVGVYLDPDKLNQVFTNLVGNSIRFTEKGHIEVSLKDSGNEIECSVADTGIGISRDDLPKVFDKFQQFGRTAGPGEKGTGLGLSIVKGIIGMHKGRIWVESEFGKGARFTFTLPKHTFLDVSREYVDKAIREAAKKDSKMSIIVVFIDDFAKIKPGLSAEEANSISRQIKVLIENNLRMEGDVAINGLGEFLVVLSDCDKDDALNVEKRLKAALEEYLAEINFSAHGKLHLSHASYPLDAPISEELIKKARVS